MRARAHTDRDDAPPGGDLAALIAIEVKLAEELAAAERQAARLVDEARALAASTGPAAPADDGTGDPDLAARDALADLERELSLGLAALERDRRDRLEELASLALAVLVEHLGAGGAPP